MKSLPERLKLAASFVKKGAVIADVGCDHGLLPHYLLSTGTAEYAYLIDKNKGPLLRAEENTEKYGFTDKCSLCLSDGLKALPDSIRDNESAPGFPDTVIITGMGGPLILKILSEAPEELLNAVESFILSPQSLIEDFREGIKGLGFIIKEEKTVSEKGKHYIVFRALKEKRKDKA